MKAKLLSIFRLQPVRALREARVPNCSLEHAAIVSMAHLRASRHAHRRQSMIRDTERYLNNPKNQTWARAASAGTDRLVNVASDRSRRASA